MIRQKDMHRACPFLFVVLRSEISQNFNEIIEEIGKWVEILDKPTY